jgi:hypothetical protein
MSWSLIKTLFSEVTNSMILFVNSKNMDALYKEVDKTQLITKFGGTI